MYRFTKDLWVWREAHCFLAHTSRNLPETFGSLGSHTDAAGGHRRIAHGARLAHKVSIIGHREPGTQSVLGVNRRNGARGLFMAENLLR